ncbi:MAG: response regulator [Armatimonadetes bacterium]|nr:response regulator [Armatimonadota bacterium]
MMSGASESEHGRVDILVVEDDSVYRMVLVKRLADEGFRILPARDGEEGLRLARESRPEMIVSDLMMPKMDGQTLCEGVRADPELHSTYILLLTAHDGIEAKLSGLESGADDYLVKPCNHRELIARVRVGLRIRKLQRENIDLVRKNTALAMAVTLNHEINNQLAGAMAAAEGLLLSKSPDDPDTRKLNIILQCAANIRDIVARLRNIRQVAIKPYLADREMVDIDRSSEEA